MKNSLVPGAPNMKIVPGERLQVPIFIDILVWDIVNGHASLTWLHNVQNLESVVIEQACFWY